MLQYFYFFRGDLPSLGTALGIYVFECFVHFFPKHCFVYVLSRNYGFCLGFKNNLFNEVCYFYELLLLFVLKLVVNNVKLGSQSRFRLQCNRALLET